MRILFEHDDLTYAIAVKMRVRRCPTPLRLGDNKRRHDQEAMIVAVLRSTPTPKALVG